jgi:hypothetical protein
MKDRTIPLKILILEALLRHLPLNHPKRPLISEELRRRQAGYHGEVSLDIYFSSLPKQKYMILHDLNLPDGDYNCQIDTLLLTPEFALVIEVKNMAGKLIFDTENEQFIQINNGKEKGYPYPIAQAERHQNYIKKLMVAHHFPPVPIDYLVINSNGYSSYAITGNNAYNVRPRVSKADVFLKKLQFFENKYTNPLLTAKDLRKLSRLLLKMNTPPTSYFFKNYGIQRSDLLTGVHCPSCTSNHPQFRDKQKWYCPSCHKFSKDAHINALKDYFLLFNTKITNQQFREFTHLKSADTAKRLLLSTNLDYSGTNKLRFYFPKTFPW